MWRSRAAELSRVVSVYSDVLSGQVGGEKRRGAATALEQYPNITGRLRQIVVRSGLIETSPNAAATNSLFADENTYEIGVNRRSARANRGENPSPVWIRSCPGCFH